MADNETWYYADQTNTLGPMARDRMEGLVGAGVVTPSTLVWPGVGDWIPAAQSSLAPQFGRGAESGLLAARPVPSSDKTSKKKMRPVFLVLALVLGIYAMYAGLQQASEGISELGGSPSSDNRTDTVRTQVVFQCGKAGAGLLQCDFQNRGQAEEAICLDVVIVCDDARHVASTCSGKMAPGESETKLVDNLSPEIPASASCTSMRYENVKGS